MAYRTFLLRGDTLRRVLGVDKDKPHYVSLAYRRDLIIAEGKPITRSVKYNDTYCITLPEMGFIISHQDGKTKHISFLGGRENPFTVLGDIMTPTALETDNTFSELLDMIDEECVGELIMNLDDPDQFAGMQEECPEILKSILDFYSSNIPSAEIQGKT